MWIGGWPMWRGHGWPSHGIFAPVDGATFILWWNVPIPWPLTIKLAILSPLAAPASNSNQTTSSTPLPSFLAPSFPFSTCQLSNVRGSHLSFNLFLLRISMFVPAPTLVHPVSSSRSCSPILCSTSSGHSSWSPSFVGVFSSLPRIPHHPHDHYIHPPLHVHRRTHRCHPPIDRCVFHPPLLLVIVMFVVVLL